MFTIESPNRLDKSPLEVKLYFSMVTRLPPAAKPLLRGRLSSRPSNGHVVFIPQIRKLVFEYCDKWPSSSHCRNYIFKNIIPLAKSNPHVEIVVRQRIHKEPIIRGFYCNFSLSNSNPSNIYSFIVDSCSERQRKGYTP